jgi:hypothetical protein
MSSRAHTAQEPDFEDQYIAVLLEHYWCRSESELRSPIEMRKINYTKSLVSVLEEDFPARIQRRIQYRTKKAEKGQLSATQVALIHYAWAAFYRDGETPAQVRKRWMRYLNQEDESEKTRVVTFARFLSVKRVKAVIDEIVGTKHWPWACKYGQNR